MIINWKNIQELHVNKKIETIVGEWFGLDFMYVDDQGRIQTDVRSTSHHFFSHFFKLQMAQNFGHEWLQADVENLFENISQQTEPVAEYKSFFPHVYMKVGKVVVDGEMLGAIIAFPYVHDTITDKEFKELKEHMLKCGFASHEVENCLPKLRKMFPRERTYLRDMVDIIVNEVETFHEEISKREDRIHELSSEVGNRYRYHQLIGKSKKMQQVYSLLQKVSSSEATILVQGENGTGKELVAKAIHYNSPRKDAVFMAVNCSAFNENLLDAELFGYVKGAFTGAMKDRKGVFEAANGGTLFLDEIGDMTLPMQVKLLRVLQEGTFLPVGSTMHKKVNVRVIAATNRPLKEMIARGEFREDLYYRINVINVHLPALRERNEDIPLLMDFFLEKQCAEAGKPLKTFAKKTLEKMMDYPWPGNVRELENEIKRLLVLCGDEKTIMPEILNSRILEHGESMHSSTTRSHAEQGSVVSGINTKGSLKEATEELEILMIREGLKRCEFNKSKLAKELGISRAGLIMKVDKYGLDKRHIKKAVGE
jgi:two-component system response regulator HupR/HoxA